MSAGHVWRGRLARETPAACMRCFLAADLVASAPAADITRPATPSRFPTNVQTIAIPAFVNRTQTYHIEQTLTAAVVHELTTRTHYHILNEASDAADATLRGTVLTTSTSPLTYDSQTGRASSVLVVVSHESVADRPPGQSSLPESILPVSRAVPGLARTHQLL